MKTKKSWIIGLTILATLVIIGLIVSKSYSQETPIDIVKERRLTMISYLSNPIFTNDDFCEQLTQTKAKLEINQLDESKLYFSIKKDAFEGEKTIKKLCIDSKKVEFAKLKNGDLELGNYRFYDTTALFFRFPDSLLKVPKKIQFHVNYKPFEYTVSDQELSNFISNKSIYGGSYYITKNGKKDGNVYGMNHGAMVSINNEPSLQRFTKQLIKKCKTHEQKIQALLSFVTNQIAYNFSEANSGGETLKRPNEVLLSKSSDCSGKTILFASFLEQINADYRLVYMSGHISVFVKGKFESSNKYLLKADGATYHLAETTCPDFIIGETVLNDATIFSFTQFIQKVGKPSIVKNSLTNQKFEL
jgi:hypothetical protein